MEQKINNDNKSPNIAELLVQLENTKDEELYLQQVYQIFEIYGLAHGCLFSMNCKDNCCEHKWRETPNDIAAACSNLISEDKHPAIKLGRNRQFPFDLFKHRDTFYHDPDVEALYIAFLNNNVQHAYGLPIITPEGNMYVFVVARVGPPIEMVELLTLQTICYNAVQKVHQFKIRPCEIDRQKKLTTDERDVLISLAKGDIISDVFDNLDLPQSEIEKIQNNVLDKFSAQNISHAIVLALIEGEFELTDCKI